MGRDKVEPFTPYAVTQFAKAIRALTESRDPGVSESAAQRMRQWSAVIQGLESGAIKVGSRRPLDHVPVWVTLDVVHGGFATGDFAAGGPFQQHESDLCDQLGVGGDPRLRRVLNGYYLTEKGLQQLRDQLETGHYVIELPEEGALLVVAWLVKHDHVEEACTLLDTLTPWFPTLRFYPVPTDGVPYDGPRVSLYRPGQVQAELSERRPSAKFRAQQEAIEVWTPLYDRAVALFLETVDGEVPQFRRTADGALPRESDGSVAVAGGWPCRHYPEGWSGRAQALLQDYTRLRRTNRRCGKPERRKENFYQLRRYLNQCVEDPASLRGRDVGRIRLILARTVEKRGVPASPDHCAVRTRQKDQIEGPELWEMAAIVAQRLNGHGDVVDVEAQAQLLQPITDSESQRWGVRAGATLHRAIRKKVAYCVRAPVADLIDRGVIRSGETLASLSPQLSGNIEASEFESPALRQLYASIYRAFRKRRSLLLLNLEKQVQLDEVPWVTVLKRFKTGGAAVSMNARQCMTDLLKLTITNFPYSPLSNRLLRELDTLAQTAGLDVPVAEELAADIFMGRFSQKFVDVVLRNGRLLEGSLYSTYYQIDHDQLNALTNSWGEDPLCLLCKERAGFQSGDRWTVAVNGQLIEQQQILASHNMALLLHEVGLSEYVAAQAAHLSRQCFVWIRRQLWHRSDSRRRELIQLKQCAYGWRQMVFYLSSLTVDEHQEFLTWAHTHLASHAPQLHDRMTPALEGLRQAMSEWAGVQEPKPRPSLRPFLGWTTGVHPMSVIKDTRV